MEHFKCSDDPQEMQKSKMNERKTLFKQIAKLSIVNIFRHQLIACFAEPKRRTENAGEKKIGNN